MNKRQPTDTIGQAIRDLELAKKRVLELEAEVVRLMLPVVDWDNAPEWAEWCAVDDDGSCFWYKSEPRYSSHLNGWFTSDELMINRTFVAHYAPHSLQRRPARKDDNNE